MRIRILIISISVVLFSTTLLVAQKHKYVEAYNTGNFDKCISLCEKAKKSDSKDLTPMLYEALSWVALYQIPADDKNYNSEYKKGVDKAFNIVVTIIKKDKTRKFLKQNADKYNIIRDAIHKKGVDIAKEKDIEKLKAYYEKVINSINDRRDYFYIGKAYLYCDQTSYGVRYLNAGLKEYNRQFESGIKPEKTLYDELLGIIDILIEKSHESNAFKLYEFVHLVFPENISKTKTHHLMSIRKSIDNIKYFDGSTQRSIREISKAYNFYSNDEFLAPINAIVRGTCNRCISESEYDSTVFVTIDEIFRLILDSIPKMQQNIEIINSDLKHFLFANTTTNEIVGNKFYSELLALNSEYLKIDKKKLALSFVEENKNDYRKYGYTLMYFVNNFSVNAEQKVIFTEYEKLLVKELKKFETNPSQYREVSFWLKVFPAFLTYKEFAKSYFQTHIRFFISNLDFSKAQLLLGYAKRYFPNDKDFLVLKKECVSKDYQANYIGTKFNSSELKWTGSVENCEPGTISELAQTKTLQRLCFFRRLAGLPDNCVFDFTKNRYCQAAALCMFAENALSHAPNENWYCFSEDAFRGARSSNLGIGYCCSDGIDQQFEDSGDHNKEAGHRAWLMTAKKKQFAYGATTNTVAMWTNSGEMFHDSIVEDYATEFVVWPPEGPVPNELIYQRWSFEPYNYNFNFENPQIKMTCMGKSIETKIDFISSTKIVWQPIDLDLNNEKENIVKVSITANVRKYVKTGYTDYKKKTFTYEVIIYPEN
jgi:hypothetical protein